MFGRTKLPNLDKQIAGAGRMRRRFERQIARRASRQETFMPDAIGPQTIDELRENRRELRIEREAAERFRQAHLSASGTMKPFAVPVEIEMQGKKFAEREEFDIGEGFDRFNRRGFIVVREEVRYDNAALQFANGLVTLSLDGDNQEVIENRLDYAKERLRDYYTAITALGGSDCVSAQVFHWEPTMFSSISPLGEQVGSTIPNWRLDVMCLVDAFRMATKVTTPETAMGLPGNSERNKAIYAWTLDRLQKALPSIDPVVITGLVSARHNSLGWQQGITRGMEIEFPVLSLTDQQFG